MFIYNKILFFEKTSQKDTFLLCANARTHFCSKFEVFKASYTKDAAGSYVSRPRTWSMTEHLFMGLHSQKAPDFASF